MQSSISTNHIFHRIISSICCATFILSLISMIPLCYANSDNQSYQNTGTAEL